jgi:hypothetical protein
MVYVIVNYDLNVLNQVEYRCQPRQWLCRDLACQDLVEARYSPDCRRRLIRAHWNVRISRCQYAVDLVFVLPVQLRHLQRGQDVSLPLVLVRETNLRVCFEILHSRMSRSVLVN